MYYSESASWIGENMRVIGKVCIITGTGYDMCLWEQDNYLKRISVVFGSRQCFCHRLKVGVE